ncbi:MAG: glutathione S-transferase family protein [Vitreimonas sp.]
MKLLSSPLSPFAARVRLAIYAKNLPVEIAPANMWQANGEKSPDYLALNPLGKVPALILDDGGVLPESDTIVEFLADRFPDAELRPRDPRAIAHGRLLARIVELYVMTPGVPLFGQLLGARNEAAIEQALAGMDAGLASLNHFMTGTESPESAITTADCALAPYLYFFPHLFGCAFSGASLIAKHEKVAGYYERLQRDASVQRVIGEIRGGLAGSRLKGVLAGED